MPDVSSRVVDRSEGNRPSPVQAFGHQEGGIHLVQPRAAFPRDTQTEPGVAQVVRGKVMGAQRNVVRVHASTVQRRLNVPGGVLLEERPRPGMNPCNITRVADVVSGIVLALE